MRMMKIDGWHCLRYQSRVRGRKGAAAEPAVCRSKDCATQQELAIYQTARNAYAQVLQAELAKEN